MSLADFLTGMWNHPVRTDAGTIVAFFAFFIFLRAAYYIADRVRAIWK